MNDRLDPPIDFLKDTAIQAAIAGGAELLKRWKGARKILFKGEIDLVTDADRASEAAVVGILRARFPDHQILAEEGSSGGESPRFRWIVDPLDGTTNYAHGYPHFAVSVALERDGEILTGAVYDPIRDEMFSAAVDLGAFLNRSPLRVSTQTRLLGALLCTGFPYDRSRFSDSLRRWEHFVRRSQAVRRDGSAALDMCYVAAGRFDGFFEESLGPWDAAAGSLLVREAGGIVSNFMGAGLDLYRGDVVASNGTLHGQLLEGIAGSAMAQVAGVDEEDG